MKYIFPIIVYMAMSLAASAQVQLGFYPNHTLHTHIKKPLLVVQDQNQPCVLPAADQNHWRLLGFDLLYIYTRSNPTCLPTAMATLTDIIATIQSTYLDFATQELVILEIHTHIASQTMAYRQQHQLPKLCKAVLSLQTTTNALSSPPQLWPTIYTHTVYTAQELAAQLAYIDQAIPPYITQPITHPHSFAAITDTYIAASGIYTFNTQAHTLATGVYIVVDHQGQLHIGDSTQPTTVYIGNKSVCTIKPNGRLAIAPHSKLVIQAGGKLYIEKGAIIHLADACAEIQIEAGAEVYIYDTRTTTANIQNQTLAALQQ